MLKEQPFAPSIPHLYHIRPQFTRREIVFWNVILFLGLIGLLLIFSAAYWRWVLSPQLTAKANIGLRALAGAHAATLAAAMVEREADDVEAIRHEFTVAAHRLLLLTDPNTEASFISGVRLEVDADVIVVPSGELDFRLGKTDDTGPRPLEIPLYSPKSGELVAIARCYPNPDFYHRFKEDIRRTYSRGVGLGAMMLLAFGGAGTVLLVRIQSAELKLREKQGLMIHAGRLSALGEMAAGIAHEINQPLAIMRIAADGLTRHFAETNRDSMEARAVGKIVQQVQRAADIITHLRSFVSPRTIDAEEIELSEPIRKGLSFFQEQFRLRGIELIVELETPVPRALINSNRLEQIVVNLLSNARYAVEQKAKSAAADYRMQIGVRLFGRQDGSGAVFEVWDNGVGMSSEVQRRCLEPFYTTKSVGEGMGLGLSIAHAIAKDNGLEIQIQSQNMQGARFFIVFPTPKASI